MIFYQSFEQMKICEPSLNNEAEAIFSINKIEGLQKVLRKLKRIKKSDWATSYIHINYNEKTLLVTYKTLRNYKVKDKEIYNFESQNYFEPKKIEPWSDQKKRKLRFELEKIKAKAIEQNYKNLDNMFGRYSLKELRPKKGEYKNEKGHWIANKVFIYKNNTTDIFNPAVSNLKQYFRMRIEKEKSKTLALSPKKVLALPPAKTEANKQIKTLPPKPKNYNNPIFAEQIGKFNAMILELFTKLSIEEIGFYDFETAWKIYDPAGKIKGYVKSRSKHFFMKFKKDFIIQRKVA